MDTDYDINEEDFDYYGSDIDGGYEDYEPSPYNGDYSEE